ncbi:MAG: hypothetical protein GX331_08675 [Firmicutes bacterium]|nr:hypothetical protein [Bacillota bacterium]
MRIGITVAVILIVIVGGGLLWFYVLAPSPADVAEAYLEHIKNQDLAAIEEYYDQEQAYPSEDELAEAFRDFADAFGLVNTEIVDFAPISEKWRNAKYSFELKYESKYFDPIVIQSNISLIRKGIRDWKILWNNDLPLPQYGLDVSYSQIRLEPRRGSIYDRSGNLLAGEGSLISVGVQPDRIKDPEALFKALQEQLGLSPEYVKSKYEAPGVQGHWFVPLISITEEKYAVVDDVLRPVPGIFFRREESRAYPGSNAAAHITGYMGEVTAGMIKSYPERDYAVGEIVGRSGLELSKDDLLRGRPGYRFYVEPKDSDRIMLAESKVVRGQDLHLTLDLEMQELAFDVLGDRVGSFVVIDATSGEVLVLVSTPSYDPNEFVLGISTERWQELSTDKDRPLFNRALQGLYPPGSVFKVVTASAALDQGIYEVDSEFDDDGELRVEGNIIRNFEQQVFGRHTLADGVVQSINTTIAQIGLSLGASNLKDYFSRWELGQAPQFGIPAQGGQIGEPERSKVALAWSAIGQDRVLLTPFHVAQIFSVFANQGALAHSHLLASEEETDEWSEVISPDTAYKMNRMLRRVVLEGTGKGADVSGLEVYGKTGTAETAGSVHAWFGGHVQIPDGRQLAFGVLVEDGGVGGRAAAPLVKDFLTRLVQ